MKHRKRRRNGIIIGNSLQLSQIRYNTKGSPKNDYVINVVSDSDLSVAPISTPRSLTFLYHITDPASPREVYH